MLRGRLVKLGDKNVEDIKAPPEAQWVLNGDRGLTYADDVPEGSKLVAGEWWPADYSGEPLVSFEAELATSSASRSATRSPSTCSAATSPPASPTCAR